MKEEHELFHAFLTQQGQRFTAVRQKILNVVLQSSGPFTAQSLLPHIRIGNSGVDRASLYRNLKLLKQAGLIEELPEGDPSGAKYYILPRRTGRKYVLFCPGCHSEEPFSDERFDHAVLHLCRRFHLNPDSVLVKVEARHLRDGHSAENEDTPQ